MLGDSALVSRPARFEADCLRVIRRNCSPHEARESLKSGRRTSRVILQPSSTIYTVQTPAASMRLLAHRWLHLSVIRPQHTAVTTFPDRFSVGTTANGEREDTDLSIPHLDNTISSPPKRHIAKRHANPCFPCVTSSLIARFHE